MVADRLDVVAVRIEDEGGVVVRGVLRAEAGGAVVRSSGGDGRDVERVDRGAVVALERDVRPADRPATPDPEVESVRIRQVRERSRLLVHDAVAERLQRSQVERLRGLEVGDVDGDVRERHSGSSRSVQSPRMILDNGVVRTMDPSLPTTRALAIAGDVRRRRRRHARDGRSRAPRSSTSADVASCPASRTRTSTSRPGR